MSKIKVLAVEDSRGDAVILQRYLAELKDWEVEFEHFDGQGDVRPVVERLQPDLLFLDHCLGAKTGFDVLAELEGLAGAPPVIVLTGRGDEEVAVQVLTHGARDYLPKAKLTPEALERTVRNTLEQWRLEQEVIASRLHLEETNRHLEERNREIGRFYHTLSHELRSPITYMGVYLSLLADGEVGPLEPEQAKFLDIISQGCEQLDRCIADLIDVTRLETGKLLIERGPVELEALVLDVVLSLDHQARQSDIELFSNCAEAPEVLADSVRVRQVVQNLIGNALKFTPAGGTVEAGIEPVAHNDEVVRVFVRDTGRGIPGEQLERIFERLHQVDSESDVGKGGLGLGLSISKEIVELHGGVLGVTSTLGQGSTFHFTLPLAPAPERVEG